MVSNTTSSVKNKRVSKNRKVAWRKYCDTTDVDAFLEDKRHEERTGVVLSELGDSELFIVDTTPEVKTTRNVKKNYVLQKPPRCLEILYSYSAVPCPVKQRNRIKTQEEKRHPIAKNKELKRLAEGKLTAKEKNIIKSRAVNEERKEKEKKEKNRETQFNRDIWGNEEGNESNSVDVQWLNSTTLTHTLRNTGKFKKRISKCLLKKPSVLPSIEIPHPGTSYNPSYNDHQALLQEIAKTETSLIKEETHLKRVTTNMFSRITMEEHEDLVMKEYCEGHPKISDHIQEEEEEDNGEYKAINPPVKDKTKTRPQRNKQKLLKEEQRKRQLAKIEKKKVADIYKLRKIDLLLKKKEVKSLKRKEALKKKEELKKLQAKQLSKKKFEKPDLDFTMPSNLSGNLRNITTEGNLLRDRFKSLQERNILECTVMQGLRKKPKRKVYTKNSHK